MNEDLARLWPIAERILDDVLDLFEPVRTMRALEACAGDPALERAVREILSADRDSVRFLAELPTTLFEDEETQGAGSEPTPLERIGPFRIVGELGRGGMGTVLLGERDDGAFEQRVAVKILHRGRPGVDVRDILVRERRILARLEHPEIARMYDGGVTPDGEPYFIMEFVDGLPLDAYCDDHRLGIAERLRLFRRVCRAVEYAHGRFVVHCDLKPRNILVTKGGEVKLVDFGIARFLEEEILGPGSAGALALTPAYAAPEQALGTTISAATDVYQLGLVLYELLSGERARGEGHASRSEIEPPSAAVKARDAAAIAARHGTTADALSRRLLGDLDAILLKALRPDPTDRYPTVGALRRDLEDFLANRPISARPATPAYRLRKLVARHRWAVAAASAVIVSVLGGLIGVAAQSRAAATERDRASLAERRAAAVNDFVLHELLRAPMPESSLGRELTVGEVLANAARSVEHAFEGEPLTEAEVRLALARTYSALGRAEDAAVHAQEARDLLSRSSDAPRLAVEEAERTLAEISFDAGRYAEARNALEALYRRQLQDPGPSDPETLRTAAALGRTLTGVGEYARAETILRDALAAAESERPELWRLAGEIEGPLARALQQQSDGVEAERITRRMLDRIEGHLGADHPERIGGLTLLGNTLIAQLRYKEAEDVIQQAVALSRNVFGPHHPATADGLYAHALALERLGRYDDALAALTEAHAVARQALGPDHPKTVFLYFGLAILTRNAGNVPAAEAMFREVVASRARTFGDGNAETIRALRSLYLLLHAQDRTAEARAVAVRIIRGYEVATTPLDADPDLVTRFGEFLLEARPVDLQDQQRALTLAERAVAETGRRRYLPLRLLGDALERMGRTNEAVAALQEALDLPDGIRSWSTEERVLDLLSRTGTPAEVESFLRSRIATQRARTESNERMIAKSLRLLALHLEAQGRRDEAEGAHRESLEILRRVVPPDNWELGRALSEIGGCLAASGRYAEAEPHLIEGLRILESDRQAVRARDAARKRLAEFREGGPVGD